MPKTVRLKCSTGVGYGYAHIVKTAFHNKQSLAGMGCALTIDGLVNTQGTDLTFRPLEPAMKADLFFARKNIRRFQKRRKNF